VHLSGNRDAGGTQSARIPLKEDRLKMVLPEKFTTEIEAPLDGRDTRCEEAQNLAFGKCASDFAVAQEWMRRALGNCGDSHVIERFMLRFSAPPVRVMVVGHLHTIAQIGKVLAKRGNLSQPEVVAILEDA